MDVNNLLMRIIMLALLGAVIFYGSRVYANVARRVPA